MQIASSVHLFFICTAIKGVGQRFMQNCFSFYYSNKMLKNALDFVKIILKENGNFDLALRKVHRIIALVSSYNPSKINSKYFSSLNPYALLFIILILLFIPSTLALDIW